MPSPVVEILSSLDAALRSAGVRWYLFGAQAAILHGAARLTADIDVTIDLGQRPIADVVTALEHHGFRPRIEDVDGFVGRTRVLPAVHQASGMAIDLVIAGTGLEALFFKRAQPRTIEGVEIRVASAEDIVVMKILAGRDKDLDDAAAILAAQADTVDFSLIRSTLEDLEAALDRSDLLPLLDRTLGRSHC